MSNSAALVSDSFNHEFKTLYRLRQGGVMSSTFIGIFMYDIIQKYVPKFKKLYRNPEAKKFQSVHLWMTQ